MRLRCPRHRKLVGLNELHGFGDIADSIQLTVESSLVPAHYVVPHSELSTSSSTGMERIFASTDCAVRSKRGVEPREITDKWGVSTEAEPL
jgi:hypothetical protein